MKTGTRKMKFMQLAGSILMIAALGLMTGCSKDNSPNDQKAHVSVSMTDAPGDYDAVLVDVQDVMIQDDAAPNADAQGWVSLNNVQTGVYDLLTLTGGVTQLLADADIPAGKLSQIRLVLGDNNSVVKNGETQPLSTPSAQQSGLKLQVNQTLEAGKDYAFLLDFNVDQSIVSAGSSGGFILKPVIRVSADGDTGTIEGSVHPTTFQSMVTATSANYSISAYTDADGNFSLHGVPEGIYKITVTPAAASGLASKEVNDVQVTTGETTTLDTIFLE
ncbi:MAG: DUF4382 domain-containing protein [Gillisia sp.]